MIVYLKILFCMYNQGSNFQVMLNENLDNIDFKEVLNEKFLHKKGFEAADGALKTLSIVVLGGFLVVNLVLHLNEN